MDSLLETIAESPIHLLLAVGVLLASAFYGLFALLHLIAPKPRPVLPSEKTYITTVPNTKEIVRRQLPCWHDRWQAERRQSEHLERKGSDPAAAFIPDTGAIEPAEVLVSVVFPAYNEEDRILPTLEEAVEYLDATYGRTTYLETRQWC
ncbi:hypothetical protein NPX13_g8241 [Xylaria arbuscula]|uniref:Uncharacterized protein n=1 Tax=Xylaria arbuscula TaxID=114810 RepID=A0A9W8TIS6_9PEZI|nr:hypothetical protein NPX13_g8241 [Xylaria arbuscula]